ncbi:response regulator receiver protein [Desulfarculus baarsii DSM 2075]|uniref:Response regulator receiver protein n=1 Tax=Desulfarculus baarsii (strain ATCC 33931 / DSM 2075 / LMG 7858 / VKM B-1802 / 2st14) TaxID=644282 RepID=E1QDY3_DESB2|nr:response regulator [Desulfarculus baarsii]ADK83769.1 response regulator receiver protein [Desulfarculus baarsii DSM 2075]
MANGLDVIILDDERQIAEHLKDLTETFYSWGQVHAFSDALEARTFCFNRESSLAIFVLDMFLGGQTAFDFIEAVTIHYPMAAEDSVIITGHAGNDIVNMCMAAGVTHLLEKPIKPYAYQFAVRAIANKYLRFAKKLMHDPELAGDVARMALW